MSKKRRIYLLDNKKLNPETIAVTFAKTSRSPKNFDDIASELSDEKSTRFHEKWVVGYGHSSVAEHAVLHIAVENVSRLAVECLESNRLASYTEKSSRYQVWDENNFFIPQEVIGSPLEQTYVQAVRTLFQKYLKAVPVLRAAIENTQQGKHLSEREVHTCCMDVCRFYLPAASTANVGITINARALEHALRKMLSNPLEEVRQIGAEIKEVAIRHLPALIKYVDEVPYLQGAQNSLPQMVNALSSNLPNSNTWCDLVDYDPDFERHILSALMYRFGRSDLAGLTQIYNGMERKQKQELAHMLLGQLDRHDIPLRELEYGYFMFDLLMDQGAYFEFKRHRMMTQTPQMLSPDYGYALPRLIAEAGLESDFCEAMDIAKEAYQKIATIHPHAAGYVIPNAYNRRVLASFNLRTALHFIKLRTAPNAHFSIRRIADRMAETLCEKMDVLKPYFQPQNQETWQQIEKEYFSAVIRH